MHHVRRIGKKAVSRETIEGAGVRLNRAFGYHDIPDFDPFLMLDDFRSENPQDYLPGFPWHPHRGIETVTYMLKGTIEHGDSMGHTGSVNAGGVQWMTAGSGIIHQEMPKPVNGLMGGFQLWVNLPASHKMMDPRYQEIVVDKIPVVRESDGTRIMLICGTLNGVSGPVQGIISEPEFLDVSLDAGTVLIHPVKNGYTVAIYIIGGSGRFDQQENEELGDRNLILYTKEGDRVEIRAGNKGVRFLLFSGKPLREPVAWGGPIVMNTREELDQAFSDLKNDSFIRIHNT